MSKFKAPASEGAQQSETTTLSSGPVAERRVFNIVVDAITQHQVKPGERLVERELAAAAGVNRLAIRNGLAKLAHSGFVVLEPNKGASVAAYSAEQANHIFVAREAIEGVVVRSLAQSISKEDATRLGCFVEKERLAYQEDRFADARQLSREFHVLLADIEGNSIFKTMIRDLITRQPLLPSFGTKERPCFCGNGAHREIVEAIVAGDGEKAALLSMKHLRKLEQEMNRSQSSYTNNGDNYYQ